LGKKVPVRRTGEYRHKKLMLFSLNLKKPEKLGFEVFYFQVRI